MDFPIVFSENIVKEMAAAAAKEPALSSDRAELFLSSSAPVAAINVKVAFEEYLGYLSSLPEAVKPDLSVFVPQEREDFQILINGPVKIEGEKTFFNGKEVVLL